MCANPVFGRIATAVITPFDSRGNIDFAAAKRLADYLAAHGTDTAVVAGTTGEGATLSAEERVELFKFWVDSVPDNLMVVANTGTNVTSESAKLTEEATKAGVDGIMAVMPYYNKPNTGGQIRHFRIIAQSTDKPVLLYNVPSRTGGSMTLEAIYQLSGVSNIAAIKEASGDLDFVSSIIKNSAKDFAVYSGDDSLTLPILAVGGVGVVSVASHIVGPQLAEMVRAFVKGDVERAARIHLDLLGVFKALFATTNPIPVKTAVAMMGLVSENFRLPMTPAPDEVKNRLAGIMNEHGLFPGIPSK